MRRRAGREPESRLSQAPAAIMCLAWADLAQAYRDARAPDRAQAIAATAAGRGCKGQ